MLYGLAQLKYAVDACAEGQRLKFVTSAPCLTLLAYMETCFEKTLRIPLWGGWGNLPLGISPCWLSD